MGLSEKLELFRKLNEVVEIEVLKTSKPIKRPKEKPSKNKYFKNIANNPKFQNAIMGIVELIYSEKYGETIIIPEFKEVIFWNDITDVDEFIRIHLKDKTEKKIKQIIGELEFGFGWNIKNGNIE